MKYDIHPFAAMFPLLQGDEFTQFVADINEHGQRVPIVVYQGQILDGRNRIRACEALGIEPVIEEWQADGSPLAFIASMNLPRRRLGDTQRAFIAARLATATKGEGNRRIAKAVTRDEAADLMNVTVSAINQARLILRDGTPTEIALAEAGRLPLSISIDIRAQVPPEERARRNPEREPGKKRQPAKRVSAATQRILARIAEDEAKKRAKSERDKATKAARLERLANEPATAPLTLAEMIASLTVASADIPVAEAAPLVATVDRVALTRLIEWLIELADLVPTKAAAE